jgi:hypothetical protein
MSITTAHETPAKSQEETRDWCNGRVDKENHEKEDAFTKNFSVLKVPRIRERVEHQIDPVFLSFC